jgi:hypothetical protein
MRLPLQREMRQEGARSPHHAPEIDVDQPFHLREVDLGKSSHQRDAGIVDEDVERRMRAGRGPSEFLDRLRVAHVENMRRDLARMGVRDLAGDRLQGCAVAVGQRQVATARGEFNRERAADAVGGAGDGGGGSSDGSHRFLAPQSHAMKNA